MSITHIGSTGTTVLYICNISTAIPATEICPNELYQNFLVLRFLSNGPLKNKYPKVSSAEGITHS